MIKAAEARSYPQWYLLALIPVLGGLFYWIALRAVEALDVVNTDFFTFWLAGHLARLGANPYIKEIWLGGHYEFGATWITNATFIYPLPVSWIFAPLGMQSVFQAFVVWMAVSLMLIAVSLALLLNLQPAALARSYALPLACGVAASYPTILALHNGQFSPFLLLVLTGIAYLWEKEKWWQGSLLLPVLAFKPNLGVPIIAFLSFYLIVRRKIRALGAGFLFGLALLLLSLLQNPNWILEFWRAGNTKLSQIFGLAPTIWGVSSFLCGYRTSCAVGYGMAACLILAAGYVWLVVRKREALSPIWAIGPAITITLMATPTAWPYDQLLLLIPLVASTMRLARAGLPFLPVALVYFGFDTFAFIMIGIAAAVKMGIWNIALPLFVLVLLGWALTKEPRAEEDAPAM